jgi:hypothetical protein
MIVEERAVTGTGDPEVALIAVWRMVASGVDDASIAKRRMTMIPVFEVLLVFAYAAMLAASGVVVAVKPSGSAKARLLSAKETFGGGHAGKSQEPTKWATELPSGHSREMTGHAIGCVGFSTAFL